MEHVRALLAPTLRVKANLWTSARAHASSWALGNCFHDFQSGLLAYVGVRCRLVEDSGFFHSLLVGRMRI